MTELDKFHYAIDLGHRFMEKTVVTPLMKQLHMAVRKQYTGVQRQLREQHGNRDFVSRTTRYDISSFLDWGVITEAKKKAGVYLSGKLVQLRNAEQLAWLVEAVLISRGTNQMAFSQLSHHPILFPVSVQTINSSVLRNNPRLKVARQGLNEDFVFLDQSSPTQP